MQKERSANADAAQATPRYWLQISTRTYSELRLREFHFYLTSSRKPLKPADMKIISSRPVPEFIQKQLLEHPPEPGLIDSGRSVGHSFYSIDEKEKNAMLTVLFPKQHVPGLKGFGYYAEFLTTRYLKKKGTRKVRITNYPSTERVRQLAKVGLPQDIFVPVLKVLEKLWQGVQLSAGKQGPPFRDEQAFFTIQKLTEGKDKVIYRIFLDKWGSPSSETKFTAPKRDPDSLRGVTKHAVPESELSDAYISHIVAKPPSECNRDHLFDFYYFITSGMKTAGAKPSLHVSYMRSPEAAALQGLAEKFILSDMENMEQRIAAREHPLQGAEPK